MTPQQESELVGFLADITKQFTEFQKFHRELLENASLHICPDQSWISVEHETDTTPNNPQYIIRKSPACHQIIVKI